MSESESENESDLDFSASEDEFVPTEDDESDEDEYEESEEDGSGDAPTSSKKIKKIKSSVTVRKTTEDDDDSDSSVENYLVNPNDIDLASDFFDPNKIVATNVPKFDCNVGLSLTDSEEEIFEAVPSTSQDVKLMDFNAHENFNKNLENAKEQLRNFTSTNFGQENSTDNVTQLLAIGEPSLVAKKSSKSKKSKTKRKDVSSDESDFEEVEDHVKPEKADNVEVRIGPAIKKKTDKFQAEIEASIKRKINRRTKENQLMMHKVHLLSWIGYGNYVNKVLNSTKLMEMIVKFIPSERSYPKDKTDLDFFKQITKWYKTTVGLKNNEQNCDLKCLPPIATSLALQIQSKMAICKKDFVFIFIVLLRSMGIQCRLVINLATVPMRPAAKDLCVISTKNPEKSESSGIVKKEKKKQTKKETESSSKEEDSKDSKFKSKAGKLKPQASISGKRSEILPKSPETLSQKKTLKSKIQAAMKSTRNEPIVDPIDDKKVNLKRSVSVQSISSVNDNNKRSRVATTTFNNAKATNASKTRSNNQNGKEADPSNEDSKKSLKRRSMSLQSPSSINKVSKMSLNDTKSGILAKAKAAHMKVNPSPVAGRTRKAVAMRSSINANATSSSQNIPQLDGGNDKKSKTRNPDYKIKFPLRSRSSDVSSKLAQPMPKTVAISTPPRGRRRSNSNTIRIRLPSISRSMSKSPTSAAGHISRKSKFEKTNSIVSSSSPTKSSSKLEKISKTSSADTEETKEQTDKSKRAESSSRGNLVRPASVPSASNSDEKFSQKTEEQKKKIARPRRGQSSSQTTSSKQPTAAVQSSTKSPTPLSSKATVPTNQLESSSSSPSSPIKLASNSDKKLSSKTETISKATKIANLSKKSVPKTKSSVVVASSSSNSTVLTSTNEKKSKPIARSTSTGVEKPTKNALKRKSTTSVSSDSDFAPTPKKKPRPAVDKPLPRQVVNLKKRIDRRILSTDDESIEPPVKKDDMNYWIEVYCEADSKWICIDLFKVKVDCVDEIKKKATKPIAYVFAWNNNNKIKDVSPRYCSQWNTTTRKLRVPHDWLDEAIARYKEPLSQRCVAEDRELEEIHAQTPIPTSISELKNHPLYVLPRHLLKFEGIYPPNPVPVAYIKDEPIYSRLCVHTLHSREIWVKQARVVNPGEIPYKIVKARPKWDRLANKMLEAQPLEIFGRWQTGPYVPPTAENGIVPRNAYGNVELFKPEMLPKNTVHLRLAGLNRVCHKLKIDCAQAVVGFDFHGGSSHPTFDGFVVCEEFAELVTERWCEEQEESYRKSKEKQSQRIYDNWKKLIKGLLIRQRLQRKYNFAGKDASSSSTSTDKNK